MGDHRVGCGGNGDHIHRLDSIRDILFSTAQSVPLAPWTEVQLLISRSSACPGNIFLLNWCKSWPASWTWQLSLSYNLPPAQGWPTLSGSPCMWVNRESERSQWGLPSRTPMVYTLGGRVIGRLEHGGYSYIVLPALVIFYCNIQALVPTTQPDTFTNVCLSPFAEGMRLCGWHNCERCLHG